MRSSVLLQDVPVRQGGTGALHNSRALCDWRLFHTYQSRKLVMPLHRCMHQSESY